MTSTNLPLRKGPSGPRANLTPSDQAFDFIFRSRDDVVDALGEPDESGYFALLSGSYTIADAFDLDEGEGLRGEGVDVLIMGMGASKTWGIPGGIFLVSGQYDLIGLDLVFGDTGVNVSNSAVVLSAYECTFESTGETISVGGQANFVSCDIGGTGTTTVCSGGVNSILRFDCCELLSTGEGGTALGSSGRVEASNCSFQASDAAGLAYVQSDGIAHLSNCSLVSISTSATLTVTSNVDELSLSDCDVLCSGPGNAISTSGRVTVQGGTVRATGAGAAVGASSTADFRAVDANIVAADSNGISSNGQLTVQGGSITSESSSPVLQFGGSARVSNARLVSAGGTVGAYRIPSGVSPLVQLDGCELDCSATTASSCVEGIGTVEMLSVTNCQVVGGANGITCIGVANANISNNRISGNSSSCIFFDSVPANGARIVGNALNSATPISGFTAATARIMMRANQTTAGVNLTDTVIV